MRGSAILYLLLLSVVHCRTFRDLRYDYLSDVTAVSSQRIQAKRITLFSFEMKNPGIAALAGSNLSDNLALQLRRLGYFVAEAEIPAAAAPAPAPAPVERPPVAEEPAETEEGAEKPEAPKPEATTPQVSAPQVDIPQILAKNKTPVYITGYVYETRTGSLLDEQISTGVLLRIHDERGELVAQIRYIGENTLDSYESTAGVARVLAAKIQTLTQ